MSKSHVDELISHMKAAGIVTKAAPWMVEGRGQQQFDVRYVGIRLSSDWEEVMSPSNNLLLKFSLDKTTSLLEYFLANKPPFVRILSVRLQPNDKWEWLIGELKRKLKRDKEEYRLQADKVDNLYTRIKPHLK